MTSPLRNLFILFVCVGVVACAHSKGPSPMRNQQIYSTQLLRVGLIDYGTGLNRHGLHRCPDQFPSVEVVSEATLVSKFREDGLVPERLLRWGNDFSRFRVITGLHVLFLAYEDKGSRYLRSVNYLSQSVSTVLLDIDAPQCDELLRSQQLLVVESHPPIADVSIDGRTVGEAPVWVWLKEGRYETGCALPGHNFKSTEIVHPGDVRILCQRENTDSPATAGEADRTTMEEKAGSVLVYIVGAAASVAVIVIPLLLLF